MKKVFSNFTDTIHAYAQQPNNPKAEGRTSGGNVYFDGLSLYSYGRHYELARYLDFNTVLINDTGYSATTSRHISTAKHALSQYRQFYTTQCDARAVRIQLEGIRAKLTNARKPEIYASQALALIDSYEEWKRYHAEQNRPLSLPFVPVELPIIAEMLELLNSSNFTERMKSARLAEKKRKETAEIDFRNAFKSFEPFVEFRNRADLPYSLIRINGDKVETSQGVSIPLEEALKCWSLYKLGEIRHGNMVSGYTVINSNVQTVRIGCHLLNVSDLSEVLG